MDLFLADFLCCARRDKGDGTTHSEGMSESQPAEVDFNVTHISISMADLAGYLYKSGPLKSPRKRWCVLKHDLYYFSQPEDLAPKGVILLNSELLIPQIWERTVDNTPSIEIQHAACAFVRSPELDKWIKAFQTIGLTILAAGKEVDPLPVSHDLNENEIVCEGYLEKRSFSDRWKQYWFVLRSGSLQFSTSPNSEPKGIISLSSDLMSPFVEMAPFMKEQNTLRISYCRTVYFTAESGDSHADWLSGIKASISHKRSSKAWIQKNPTGWKRSGKIREVVVPVVDTLRDPSRVEYFRKFLKDMNCEHYLRFWLDVQQFRRLCKKEDMSYLRPCCQVIYQKYIAANSPSNIYVPDELQQLVVSRLSEPNVDTFSESQQIVIQILSEYYYPFYLTSGLCREMSEKLKDGLI